MATTSRCRRRARTASRSRYRTRWACRPPRSRATAAARRSPLASNETAQGRALNRRVEVEFWHDDPLQELPDEPQMCPDDGGAEMVTKVYDPPWGRIAPLQLDNGQPIVPPGYAADLRRALADVAGKHQRAAAIHRLHQERAPRSPHRVRLRRRHRPLRRARAPRHGHHQAGSGIGSGRAGRTRGARLRALRRRRERRLHPGRDSFVRVQVVYDEPRPRDDLEGMDITPITRELRRRARYALNLMRITVDGKPIDDPGRSSSDIQRCTDVALDEAKIQFRFDDLESRPRLSVAAHPTAVADDATSAMDRSQRRCASGCTPTTPASSSARRSASSTSAQSLQAAPLAIVGGRQCRPGRMAAGRGALRGPGTRAQVRAARLRREGQFRRDGSAAVVAGPRAAVPPAVATVAAAAPDDVEVAIQRRDACPRVAGCLWRERARAAQHPARQRHGQGPGQRHPRRSLGVGRGPPGPRGQQGQLRRGGDPAVRRTHGRGRRARRCGQRLALPARPGVQAQRLVLRRHCRPDVVRRPHQRAGRPAAGRQRAPRLRFADGRPAGVLRERQVQRRLAADGERRHSRRTGRGPVQQLPGQVARLAVPAHRSRQLTTRHSATTAWSTKRRPTHGQALPAS